MRTRGIYYSIKHKYTYLWDIWRWAENEISIELHRLKILKIDVCNLCAYSCLHMEIRIGQTCTICQSLRIQPYYFMAGEGGGINPQEWDRRRGSRWVEDSSIFMGMTVMDTTFFRIEFFSVCIQQICNNWTEDINTNVLNI